MYLDRYLIDHRPLQWSNHWPTIFLKKSNMGSGKIIVVVFSHVDPIHQRHTLRIDMGMKLMIATGPRSGLEAEGERNIKACFLVFQQQRLYEGFRHEDGGWRMRFFFKMPMGGQGFFSQWFMASGKLAPWDLKEMQFGKEPFL